jgi:hypothetical protein
MPGGDKAFARTFSRLQNAANTAAVWFVDQHRLRFKTLRPAWLAWFDDKMGSLSQLKLNNS